MGTRTFLALVFLSFFNNTQSHRMIIMKGGMVSHMSHSLPGQSSVTIIRSFPTRSHSSPNPYHQQNLLQDYAASSFYHHQPSHSNHSFMNHQHQPYQTSHQSSQLAESHFNGVNSRQPSSQFANLGSQPSQFASQQQSQQSQFYSLASLQHGQRAPKAFMPSTHDHYMAGGHIQQPQTNQPMASSYGGQIATPFNGIPGQISILGKEGAMNVVGNIQPASGHAAAGSGQYPASTLPGQYPGSGHYSILSQFPDEDEIPGPFAPRFEIGKLEVSDAEATEEIKEGFVEAGLYPGFLDEVPKGLVNINYGPHGCVHMGTTMQPSTTIEPPTRLSYPADLSKYYTLILVDVADNTLHWMVVNIPGNKVKQGNTIAAYQPPSSRRSSESHRYVALALEQRDAILYGLDDFYAKQCDWSPREGFYVAAFKAKFNLDLVAGNFMEMYPDPSFSEQQCSFSFL